MWRVVLCNCAPDHSDRLAEALVRERLAACVNIIPGVKSYYEWEGELQVEQEHTLLIKTTEARYPALESRLVEMQPNSVPEIIAVPATHVFEPYLTWAHEQTSQR